MNYVDYDAVKMAKLTEEQKAKLPTHQLIIVVVGKLDEVVNAQTAVYDKIADVNVLKTEIKTVKYGD